MDLHFGTYWSLRRVRLLSSEDKMRSRFTQQGWAAHLTPAGACFLVAGALQKDRDRIRFSHLHALLVPLPPTGSVLERLEQQRRALPEGARPNVRESAAEPRGTMFAQRFGTPGGRGTCGSGQEGHGAGGNAAEGWQGGLQKIVLCCRNPAPIWGPESGPREWGLTLNLI